MANEVGGQETAARRATPYIWVAGGVLLLGFAAALVLSIGMSFSQKSPVDQTKPDTVVNALDLPENGAPFLTGTQGEEAGQFQQPRGVTVLADGSYVVVDRKARVQQFSADGKPLKLWSMFDHKFGNPKGLCAMPDGSLLVCDTHYGRVLQMGVDGKILKQWGETGKGPSQFIHPLSAVVDAQRGFAYVVEYGYFNDRIQKFKLDGTFIKAFGSFGTGDGQFQRPSGITLDRDGNLYVADAANHRVQKFDNEGTFLLAFGSEGREPGFLRYPYDIARGPDDLLYIAEFNNHRVSVFDLKGTFVRTIGQAGGGAGQFANPWALTVDARGRLFVSDTGNHRLQIFELPCATGLKSAARVGSVLRN
jgi:DNA-binding beta-propeller fold protein YncE